MRQLERHCQCHSHWHWHRPRAAGQGPIRTRRARAGSIQRYQLWYVLGSDELGALPEKFSQRWLPAQWGLLWHLTLPSLFLGCPLGWDTFVSVPNSNATLGAS